MTPKLIQFPVDVVEVKTTRNLKDILHLKLETQVLPQNDLAIIMGFSGTSVYCVLSESNLMPDEIEVPDTIERQNGKPSQSKRLRSVLYVLWGQGKQEMTSEEFYNSETEKIINHYQNKLEP
jgi:hypothetical protein